MFRRDVGGNHVACIRRRLGSEARDRFELPGRGFRLPFVTERLVEVRPPSHRLEPRAASVLSVRRGLLAVVVVAILFAIRVTAPEQIGLADALQDFITFSVSVLIESLPFVMLGIGLSVVVQLWVPQRVLFGILPRTPFLRRGALSLLGVLFPVCECGNVPLPAGWLCGGSLCRMPSPFYWRHRS